MYTNIIKYEPISLRKSESDIRDYVQQVRRERISQ
jgi:hypothetical protein